MRVQYPPRKAGGEAGPMCFFGTPCVGADATHQETEVATKRSGGSLLSVSLLSDHMFGRCLRRAKGTISTALNRSPDRVLRLRLGLYSDG